jgi:four helix bundle protein
MEPCFGHEKLDVYQIELRFLAWVTPLLQELSQVEGIKTREVSDHLERASLSVLLNTAEGNGKRQRQVRVRFFDDARGSAAECAACLDAAVAKGALVKERIQPGKELLIRIVSMLTKLLERYGNGENIHESEADYPSAGLQEGQRGRRRGRLRLEHFKEGYTHERKERY